MTAPNDLDDAMATFAAFKSENNETGAVAWFQTLSYLLREEVFWRIEDRAEDGTFEFAVSDALYCYGEMTS